MNLYKDILKLFVSVQSTVDMYDEAIKAGEDLTKSEYANHATHKWFKKELNAIIKKENEAGMERKLKAIGQVAAITGIEKIPTRDLNFRMLTTGIEMTGERYKNFTKWWAAGYDFEKEIMQKQSKADLLKSLGRLGESGKNLANLIKGFDFNGQIE